MLILTNVQIQKSVRKTPSVITLKEVSFVTVSTATRETCVRTLTSVPAELSVIPKQNVKTLKETTRVAARKGTMETAIRVSADNATTLSVPITRSACHQELKSANVKKVITSMLVPIVSTPTSVKRLFVTTKLNAQTRLEVISVLNQQLWRLTRRKKS